MATILLRIDDATLRRALRLSLVYSGFATVEHEGPSDVTITTVSEMGPPAVQEASQLGRRILVLAPLPREREHQAYLRAGAAAYVPMSGGIERLAGLVGQLLDGR